MTASGELVRVRASTGLIGGLTRSPLTLYETGARLVKAFNTLPPPLLLADPLKGEGHRVLFLSGDDHAARETVARLIESIGFAPIDLGTLIEGGKLQQYPGGPLPRLDLVKFSKSR